MTDEESECGVVSSGGDMAVLSKSKQLALGHYSGLLSFPGQCALSGRRFPLRRELRAGDLLVVGHRSGVQARPSGRRPSWTSAREGACRSVPSFTPCTP